MKHLRNHDKPIHGLKKKIKLNPKPKINPSLDLFFNELLRYKNI